MNVKQLRTLTKLPETLNLLPASQAKRYQWIGQTLRHFRYPRLPRSGCYMVRIIGYSRQQLTWLIRRYRGDRHIRWQALRIRYSCVTVGCK